MEITNEELEIKIAYLEDYVNQLNEVVMIQGKKIDKLIEVNNQLQEKVALLAEGSNQDLENRPPPHY